MSTLVKDAPRKPQPTEELKRAKKDEDEYMSDASTETSDSEQESDYSESEDDEDVLFDFSLSINEGRRILRTGDCVNHFAVDVISEAAKLGCTLRRKQNSIRITGANLTLKFACGGDDGVDIIDEAFEDIASVTDASDEAKLLAFLLAYKPDADTKKKESA
tara:strand:+ start:23445 stop:23927 length:483 start_codon:yes stop_codon:yes gene_type:complete